MDDLVWFVVASVPLIVLWVRSIIEIARKDTTAHRGVWLAVLILIPVVGLAAYLVFRPPPRPTTTAGSGSGTPAERLVSAAERHQRGELDDDGYRAELARLDRESSLSAGE